MKNAKLFFILILALSVFLAACGSGEKSGQAASSESEYLNSLGTVNRFAGVVIASGETKIEKDPGRTVALINVSAGDSVKAGQVLFVYDGTQAQNSYDKAAIELEQLRINLQSYYEERAELESMKATAYDSDSQLAYILEIQELDTTIRETAYNITQKEKEVQALAEGLGNLEVKAPSDGKVQSINAAVDSDENNTSSGQPFMVLMRTNAFRVQAYVNELNAGDLKVGDEVTVRSRTDQKTWTGKVASIDFGNPSASQSGGMESSDSDTSGSSRYPLIVDLDSSEGLMLGQHVFVEASVPFIAGTPSGAEETEAASK